MRPENQASLSNVAETSAVPSVTDSMGKGASGTTPASGFRGIRKFAVFFLKSSFVTPLSRRQRRTDSCERRVHSCFALSHLKQNGVSTFPLALLFLTLLLASSCATEPLVRVPHAYAIAGEHHVVTVEQEWYDAARARPVPVRIYLPDDLSEPAPVVVFSHGLGNSREGYSYLGEQWASHGYVSVHPEHIGGNHEVEKHGLLYLYRAGKDQRYRTMFPDDVEFVINRLTDPNGPLAGRADPKKIVVAGHSIGAYAALALAGLRVAVPREPEHSFRDPRVIAAIPMSMSERFPPKAYRDIHIPLLHLTGTHDSSIIYNTFPRHRRIPFESITGTDQYLVTIAGANHSTFSDDDNRQNARDHDIIRAATTAFLDAYARGDEIAREWLRGSGFTSFAGEDATMEIRQ